MASDESIFQPRVRTSAGLKPSQETLNAFLKGTGKAGGGLHIKDLTAYHGLLTENEAFQKRSHDEQQRDLAELIFFNVIDHSRFTNSTLLSEVVLYKYHLHTLNALDFKHPAAFIKSAEHEMSRLNAKKINDVLRMSRLQEMIAERKKILAALKVQWTELTAELRQIALYVRDNLVKIEKRCDAALVILSDPEACRTKELELIEDIKAHFKEYIKDALHRGQITKQDLEQAKKEAEELLAEMSKLVKDDTGAMTKLYGAVRDHVKKAATEIAVLLIDLESKKGKGVEENRTLYAQIEQVLVSLITDFQFDRGVTPVRTKDAHREIATAKRKELVECLLEQVQTERRGRVDRRAGRDRRKSNDPDYKGPERRKNEDRRAGRSRRRTTSSS